MVLISWSPIIWLLVISLASSATKEDESTTLLPAHTSASTIGEFASQPSSATVEEGSSTTNATVHLLASSTTIEESSTTNASAGGESVNVTIGLPDHHSTESGPSLANFEEGSSTTNTSSVDSLASSTIESSTTNATVDLLASSTIEGSSSTNASAGGESINVTLGLAYHPSADSELNTTSVPAQTNASTSDELVSLPTLASFEEESTTTNATVDSLASLPTVEESSTTNVSTSGESVNVTIGLADHPSTGSESNTTSNASTVGESVSLPTLASFEEESNATNTTLDSLASSTIEELSTTNASSGDESVNVTIGLPDHPTESESNITSVPTQTNASTVGELVSLPTLASFEEESNTNASSADLLASSTIEESSTTNASSGGESINVTIGLPGQSSNDSELNTTSVPAQKNASTVDELISLPTLASFEEESNTTNTTVNLLPSSTIEESSTTNATVDLLASSPTIEESSSTNVSSGGESVNVTIGLADHPSTESELNTTSIPTQTNASTVDELISLPTLASFEEESNTTNTTVDSLASSTIEESSTTNVSASGNEYVNATIGLPDHPPTGGESNTTSLPAQTNASTVSELVPLPSLASFEEESNATNATIDALASTTIEQLSISNASIGGESDNVTIRLTDHSSTESDLNTTSVPAQANASTVSELVPLPSLASFEESNTTNATIDALASSPTIEESSTTNVSSGGEPVNVTIGLADHPSTESEPLLANFEEGSSTTNASSVDLLASSTIEESSTTNASVSGELVNATIGPPDSESNTTSVPAQTNASTVDELVPLPSLAAFEEESSTTNVTVELLASLSTIEESSTTNVSSGGEPVNVTIGLADHLSTESESNATSVLSLANESFTGELLNVTAGLTDHASTHSESTATIVPIPAIQSVDDEISNVTVGYAAGHPSSQAFDCSRVEPGYHGNPNVTCDTKFYICVDRKQPAYEQKCPAKLRYDAEKRRCDMWAHIPACSGKPRPSTPAANETAITASPVPHVIDCQRKADGNYPDPTSTPTPYCSNRYFACVGGDQLVLACPRGLYYDNETNQCEIRSRVFACSGNHGHVSQLVTQPPVNFSCNDKNDGYYVETCSSVYYGCSGGLARLFHCPQGLVFDSEWHSCESSSDAFVCTGKRRASTTHEPHANVTVGNTTASPMNCNGRPDGIYRDPVEKCSRVFYQCVHGKTYSNKCPGKLFFDFGFKRCDIWLNVFDCSGIHATTMPGNVTIATSPVPAVDFDCSKLDDGNYVNPANNCSNFFYICANMESFKQYCPSGLYYNIDLNECVSRENVFACSGITHPPTQSTSTGGSTKAPEFDCSKQPDGNYLKAGKCSSVYFRCFAGASFKFQCPVGLFYDVTVDQCDLYENIFACSGVTRPSSPPSNTSSAPSGITTLKRAIRPTPGPDSYIGQ